MTRTGAVIGAAYELPYTRHPHPGTTTESVLVQAAMGLLSEAGMTPSHVDGLGVSSFSLGPVSRDRLGLAAWGERALDHAGHPRRGKRD